MNHDIRTESCFIKPHWRGRRSFVCPHRCVTPSWIGCQCSCGCCFLGQGWGQAAQLTKERWLPLLKIWWDTTSAAVPSGTRAISSPVAGFVTAIIPSALEATNSPPQITKFLFIVILAGNSGRHSTTKMVDYFTSRLIHQKVMTFWCPRNSTKLLANKIL